MLGRRKLARCSILFSSPAGGALNRVSDSINQGFECDKFSNKGLTGGFQFSISLELTAFSRFAVLSGVQMTAIGAPTC
jgi:hypothetical protein